MATFHVRNELVFRAPTRIGLLADVCERLAGHGVGVLALRGYEEDGDGVILVYPDDSRLAKEALDELVGTVSVLPVIVAEGPNRAGELAAIARALTNANINILQVHVTAAPGSAPAMYVLQTSNDVAALEALQNV
jgi:hypothetical protein